LDRLHSRPLLPFSGGGVVDVDVVVVATPVVVATLVATVVESRKISSCWTSPSVGTGWQLLPYTVVGVNTRSTAKQLDENGQLSFAARQVQRRRVFIVFRLNGCFMFQKLRDNLQVVLVAGHDKRREVGWVPRVNVCSSSQKPSHL
jgi:hypothetical protein